jgi:hypothetical protein
VIPRGWLFRTTEEAARLLRVLCARSTAKRWHAARPDAQRPLRALAAHKNFLTLWKDATPTSPSWKEAKAEHAKLPCSLVPPNCLNQAITLIDPPDRAAAPTMSVIAMFQQSRKSQLNRDGLSSCVGKADFAAHGRGLRRCYQGFPM